jgi:hypothetical protein
MATLGYRVWSALSKYQTAATIAYAVGTNATAVYDALCRLVEGGFAERAPGYPPHWRRTRKVMPDRMLCSHAQLANLRKGPWARGEKRRKVVTKTEKESA